MTIVAKFPPFTNDPVNHPKHYTAHPSGIECIQITQHMSFTMGNAMKYLWRADMKNGIEDLQKAKWYIEREIALRTNGSAPPAPAPELTPEAAALLDRADSAEVD